MSRGYEKIIAAHTQVTDNVSHYERLKGSRYFVWQEEGRTDYVNDNGQHTEKTVHGSTDLYTKTEFDPWADQIEDAFEAAGIPYQKTLAGTKEPETGLIHHEWTWSVRDGNDENQR